MTRIISRRARAAQSFTGRVVLLEPSGRHVWQSDVGDTSCKMCHPAQVRRVVLDSSVVISAFRSRRGASNRLLTLGDEGRIVPLATPALFLEYEDVLKRPEQRKVSGLTIAEVDVALAGLARSVEPVEVHFAWRPQLTDPDEEMVLEATANGRADALVTHNLADFAVAAPKFGVVLLRPGELLERIGR